tara:strand:+ start:366 stop:536 length:171 start_codon:yes stop_codon:yes gene_type:complete
MFLFSFYLMFSQTTYVSLERADQLGDRSINNLNKTIQKVAISATKVLQQRRYLRYV